MRVLIVEDEVKLAGLIWRGLREEGLLADVAVSGEDALWMITEAEYDAVLLDLMLPGIDGLETCRRLRESGVQTPVLMLTARGELSDRVAGLNRGADDYLIKPFAFAELIARLHAITRRGPIEHRVDLVAGELRLDSVGHRAWRGETELALTQREFLLLETLMRHPGAAMTRHQLHDHAWEGPFDPESNVVDVYIGYLRDKVDRPFAAHSIVTVRGVGYRLVTETEQPRGHPAIAE